MSKVDFISCPPFSFKKEKIIRVLKKYAEDEGYSIKKIQYNFLEKPVSYTHLTLPTTPYV